MALRDTSNTKKFSNSCCLLSCKDLTVGNRPRHFFRVRNEWIKIVQKARSDLLWLPCKNSKLCNLHFAPQDIRRLQESVRVKDNVLPTKYLFAPLEASASLDVSVPLDVSAPLEASACDPPSAVSSTEPLDYSGYLRRKLSEYKNKLKLRTQTVSRLKKSLVERSKRINKLKSQVKQLQGKSKGNEKQCFLLQTILAAEDQRRRCKSVYGMRYSDDMKKLAYILHSLSPKCYRFLRLSLALPDESSLRDWTSTIDCNPGVQLQVLTNLKQQLDEKGPQHSHVHVITDDIYLKKSPDFQKHEGKYMGHINYGPNVPVPENPQLASSSTVFVLSGLTGWKQSVGYTFSASSSGEKCYQYHADLLRTLKSFNFVVTSLGTDSHKSNVSMAEHMGVSQKDLGSKFKFTVEEFRGIRVIYDVMHIVKNFRGALFELGQFFLDESVIDVAYIERLHHIQQVVEGMRAGNQVTNQVMNYKDNIMKTKLAMKIFSKSCVAGLDLANSDPKYKDQFENYEATKRFLLDMNKAIDILNSKNSNQKGDSEPLRPHNLAEKKEFFQYFCQMLLNLKVTKVTKKKVGPRKYETVKTDQKIYLHQSTRKGIVINLITTINSILDIAQSYFDVPDGDRLFNEILTYIFCSDRIEKVFSSVRGSLGYNDNPTPSQHRKNMKRLYYNVTTPPSKNGNCLVDHADYQQGSVLLPFKRKRQENTPKAIVIQSDQYLDYDIVSDAENNSSVFSSSTIAYIAGSCVNQLLKNKVSCDMCRPALLNSDLDPLPNDATLLVVFKEKLKFESPVEADLNGESRLKWPSGSVLKICKLADHVFKSEMKKHPSSAPATSFTSEVIQQVVAGCRTQEETIFPNLLEHDNEHYYQLIALVVRQYVITHCYNYTIEYQRQVNSSRRKTKKLVQFRESAGLGSIKKPIELVTESSEDNVITDSLNEEDQPEISQTPDEVFSKPQTIIVTDTEPSEFVTKSSEDNVITDGLNEEDQPEISQTPDKVFSKPQTIIVTDAEPSLWCICKKPDNNRFMIGCDSCENWFHGKCVGITKSAADKLVGKSWYCGECRKSVADL